MNEELKKKLESTLVICASSVTKSSTAADALHFTQAMLNVAHAIVMLANLPTTKT